LKQVRKELPEEVKTVSEIFIRKPAYELSQDIDEAVHKSMKKSINYLL
jgi:hypothetical protein